MAHNQTRTRKDAVSMLHYWQRRIARYVKRKRLALGIGQKAVPGLSRSAISELENGRSNFSIKTLIDALVALEGDVSEAFESHVPQKLHRKHQHLHEMLEDVLTDGDEDEVRFVLHALETAFSSLKETDRK